MPLASLSIDLLAKLAQFEADMGKAARATEKSAQQMAGAIGIVKSGLQGLAAGISFAGLINFSKATIDSLDALNDLSDATGASVENLSGLEDIAARTGTSMDSVGAAVLKLNKAITDAQDPTSEAAKLFKTLGLNVSDLAKLDPAEALLQTAKALEGFAADGGKARAELFLLGKGTRELAPFLKDLAEAGHLNATVTKAQAEEAEKFNKELFNLQKNIQDASRSLASDLVTSINQAATALRASGLLEGFRTLVTGNDKYKNDKALVEQTDELLRLEGEVQQLRSSGTALDAAQARKKEERLKVLREEIKLTMSMRTVLAQDAALPPEVPKPKITEPGGKPLAAKQQSEAERYLETLQKQLEKTKDLTAIEQVLTDIEMGRIKGVTPAIQAQLEATAHLIDAAYFKAQADKESADREKDLATTREKAIAQADQYINGLIAENERAVERNKLMRDALEEMGLSTEALSALRVARLDAALAQEEENLVAARGIENNGLQISQIERRIALKRQERDLTAQQGAKQVQLDIMKASEDAATALHSDVKNALSNAFRDSKNPALAFAEALGNVIYTRVTNNLANSLADQLVGTGKPGSSGGLLGNLLGFLSFDGGGSTGSGPRAGGLDGKGGFMAMLHPHETVIDHTKGGSAGGPAVVNLYLTQNNGALVTPQDLARNNETLVRQIQGGLMRNQRYGGALA